MSDRTILRITGDSPRERGHDRGRRGRDGIARSWRVYDKLFEAVAARSGRTLDVPALALGPVAATRAWAPELVEDNGRAPHGGGRGLRP